MTAEIVDPFAELEEVERTFIKPNPGGRLGAEAMHAARRYANVPAANVDLVRFASVNPLVAAANPLLLLTSHLRNTVNQSDTRGLRENLIQGVKMFEANARARSIGEETVLAARYSLCTLVDETVMALRWGSAWGGHSLLVTFHNDNLGGEKVFSIIERALEDTRANIDLLELLYLCLSFGFQGRYRLKEGGRDRLNEWRDRLYKAIRAQRGEFERELSPFWKGAVEKRNPLLHFTPLWVIASCAGALMVLTCLFFGAKLSQEAEPVLRTLASIPGSAFDPKPAPIVVESKLRTFLAPEIAQGLVRVDETESQSKVTLLGGSWFGSGSASVDTRHTPLLMRIATAISEVPGRVQVIGHTDNRRIVSVRFPSNWDLSQARAEEVARLLSQTADLQSRLHAIGRGDSEPLVANDSIENRARNRRVEIVVFGQITTTSTNGTPAAVPTK